MHDAEGADELLWSEAIKPRCSLLRSAGLRGHRRRPPSTVYRRCRGALAGLTSRGAVMGTLQGIKKVLQADARLTENTL